MNSFFYRDSLCNNLDASNIKNSVNDLSVIYSNSLGLLLTYPSVMLNFISTINAQFDTKLQILFQT